MTTPRPEGRGFTAHNGKRKSAFLCMFTRRAKKSRFSLKQQDI
jgi:hypothetical protein